MDFALALDLLLVVLLVATIIYLFILSRRLSALRANRGDLDAFIERMGEATRRAESSLKGIRQAAEQAQGSLDEPVSRAQTLRDELVFLVKRADAAGERLASATSTGAAAAAPEVRTRTAKPAAARAERSRGTATNEPLQGNPASDDQDGGRSQAERDLIKALRDVR